MITINKHDALAVIDMQKDFAFPDGALYVPGIQDEESIVNVIDNIVKLTRMPFGYQVITKDTHPEVHIEHTIFPQHCISTTRGCELVDDIAHAMQPVEVLLKGQEPNTIAYSVAMSLCFDAHLFRLRNKGINRVFVVGLAYDYCVGESAIAYKVQGFTTYVILGCTRCVDEYTASIMDSKLKVYDVQFVTMKEISGE